jgi:hypothetical protein
MVLFRIAIFIVLCRSYYLLQLSSLDVDDRQMSTNFYIGKRQKSSCPKILLIFAISEIFCCCLVTDLIFSNTRGRASGIGEIKNFITR